MADTQEQRAVVKDDGDSGFLSSLVASVFEPGVNKSLFVAMNTSFLLLFITLLGLAFLTSWNWHVLFLAGVSCCLWAGMVWFVHEITQLQGSKQNLPPSTSTLIDPLSSTSNDADQRLEKGEEDAEMIKSEVDVEETRQTASNLRNRSRRVS